jgi:hypothetical protein
LDADIVAVSPLQTSEAMIDIAATRLMLNRIVAG